MIKALIKGKVRRPTAGSKHRHGLTSIQGMNKRREQKNAALNNAKSPLLQLPFEIRCLIYEYVLGGNTIVVVCGRRLKHTYTRKRWYSRDPKMYTEMYTERNERHVCICPFDEETRDHPDAGLFWIPCNFFRQTQCPKLEVGLLWTCQQMSVAFSSILHKDKTK